MTRKPKSPIARWRALPAKDQRNALRLISYERDAWKPAYENYAVLDLAIAVLKHAARKRKVK